MPELNAFEEDREAVLSDLRRGTFDYVEVASRVTEARFFRDLLEQGDLKRLAESYPTPRQKEEVPIWLYLASQLTLRLHGQHAYAAFPYILHCGGLRDALGPRQVQITEQEGGGEQRRLRCEGYNQKNDYERKTPCDPDFLRKLAKDTAPSALVAWFNRHVASYLHQQGAFDDEGVFLVDGSYLFVPDNPNYEGSSKLRFDGHSHPVSKQAYEAMAPAEQAKTGWRRCYRAVFLLHMGLADQTYPFAGLAVMAGKESEVPKLGELVDGFVKATGKGVMKTAIFDRGFIDGPTISHLKKDLGVNSVFPLKAHMLDLIDARVLAEVDGEPWTPWASTEKPKPPEPEERPERIRKRELARQKTIERLKAERDEEPVVVEKVELKMIRNMTLWGSATVPIHVVLIREHRSDGSLNEWNLATTNEHATATEVRDLYEKRTAIEERHRQLKCFWDLTAFRSRAFSLVTAQVVFVLLAYTLLQVFMAKLSRGELNTKTRERLLGELAYENDMVVLYSRNRVAYLTPLQNQEVLLSLPEDARRRVLAKTRKLRKQSLLGADKPRRPGF